MGSRKGRHQTERFYHPHHRKAVEEVEAKWQELDQPEEIEETDNLEEAEDTSEEEVVESAEEEEIPESEEETEEIA